ncbi:PAS domain S-box protein [Alloyangia pacifica]
MNDSFISTDTPVDLTNCDREPIHLLGNVQSFAALVAISADWIVQHVSRNAGALLGLDAEEITGRVFSDLLPRETVAKLREKLGGTSHENSVARLFGFDVFGDGRLFDVSAHQSGSSFIFEFEPKLREGAHDELAQVTPMLRRLSAQGDLAGASEEAAR